MQRIEGHDSHQHAAAADHGSYVDYLVGFVLSVILTVIPFWMVMSKSFSRQGTMIGIAVFAVAQVIVQLKYFLHLDFTKEGRINTLAFLFTALIIVMLVGLSIWIITTADALMMR
ncbi:cytochrome o ubiquinol oxidase subunit IV [Silvimonas iriomotensis]|uniref:Cytochrome bo(3) ubiquinol oxidase subunit 4 n=1 Tax=Silvimonas iriomotensis TaxID=449662 RepID=A0ABQ2PAM1_9NEIS|nr:cytochrome o ubiquinol oxidase subunit IV [Silvimonas iriomotensis]GGP21911.1 cytochrome bo(3) ubiquinol oxidase subunit 4 [Silvimonas iriomotensis]